MPEEILNPSDFHVGWSAQSLAGDIYVIVKATDKTVTFDKYNTVWLTVRQPTAELVRAWRRIGMQLNPVAYMGE